MFFPSLNVCLLSQSEKKEFCVLQCCSAECCNAKLGKTKPGVKSRSPSQATNHLTYCSGKGRIDLHVRTESKEDAAGRTFQVKCCSEISVHVLRSGLQQNHLSPSGHLNLKFSTENRQPTSVVSRF